VFSGGLAVKLSLLREIIQDRFQAEARLSPAAEDTLCGLLLLAKGFQRRGTLCERGGNQI
jgi:hypothetical protein